MSSKDISERGAEVVHQGFGRYHEQFRVLTRRTRERFEKCDWEGIRRDSVARMELHPRLVDETVGKLRRELGDHVQDRNCWHAMKDAYTTSILGRDDFEIAQTFFNSLSRKVFAHIGVDPTLDYVGDEFPLPYHGWEMASARMYAVRRVESHVIERVLEDAGFETLFEDPARDARLVAARVERRIVEVFGDPSIEAIDILRPLFFRNKSAYVIGRLRRGQHLLPLILAITNEVRGTTRTDASRLRVDAVLTEESDASVVFSFARWFFHVDVSSPREAIGFLSSVMPRKRTAELYISLGYNKHGKTEFYRDMIRQIADSSDLFEIAPGVPGMIMSVFHLPSFEYVFKVMRDRFPPQKRTTHRQVRERYREVQHQDRVGRLVDFQEFEHLEFPRERFSEELLDELGAEASRTVHIERDVVVIDHLYLGRRVSPLNLFLPKAGIQQAHAAVIDWGRALKDLAAADIFAGDMLIKNFGVTRHGRVVFYDYDELCPLSDCRFRNKPPPRDPIEEMSAEPWFSVHDSDVFPDELSTFLGLGDDLRTVFEHHHADLFGVDFWRSAQSRNATGEIIDFFPYTDRHRLDHDEPPQARREDPPKPARW